MFALQFLVSLVNIALHAFERVILGTLALLVGNHFFCLMIANVKTMVLSHEIKEGMS